MRVHLKATCERIRRNNGVVEALFTSHPNISDVTLQEDHVLINVKWRKGEFAKGKQYWVTIEVANEK